MKRHHPFFYIGGIFLNAVVFAAIGPLVGGWVLLALVGISHAKSILEFFFAPLLFFGGFLFSIPASYLYAAPSAALTGAIVAVASIWIRSARDLYSVAGLVGAMVSPVLLSRFEFLVRGESSLLMVSCFAVSGCLAALVCTRAARPFRLNVPAGPPLGSRLEPTTK